MSARDPAVKIRLTGRAARFVQLLQDYGHLDAEGANQLLVAVAELPEVDGQAVEVPVVRLAVVRRAAAMLLFGTEAGTDTLLDADWPLLFS